MDKSRASLTTASRTLRAASFFLFPFSFFLLALLFPAIACAQTPARCGFSFGVTPGAGVNTDKDLRQEFPFVFDIDAEGKYYLWKPFSLAVDLGFLYAVGRPKQEEYDGKAFKIVKDGRSYIRAGTGDVIPRVEIGRYWAFNPYVGGGAGAMINSMTRYGINRSGEGQQVGYDEWLWHFLALAGFDYLFDQYVALKFEARWSFAQSREPFVEKKNLGLWFGVIGVQIYL
jgi:opacity protein-like surface antigen